MTLSFQIRPERPQDAAAVTALHEEAFGPGRFARTAYRVREAADGPEITLTAWCDRTLAGAIHFTAIAIGGAAGALLLGPLAIAPAYKGQGCGLALIRSGMAEGAERGFRLVVLIGDLPYYRRAGFGVAPRGQIALPGPVDPDRLLAAELVPGSLAAYRGVVTAVRRGV